VHATVLVLRPDTIFGLGTGRPAEPAGLLEWYTELLAGSLQHPGRFEQQLLRIQYHGVYTLLEYDPKDLDLLLEARVAKGWAGQLPYEPRQHLFQSRTRSTLVMRLRKPLSRPARWCAIFLKK
jgi:hypothetical protein